MASGATYGQRLDGSRDSAINTKYRISLHSSSMREPRYPLSRIVCGARGGLSILVFLGAFHAGVRWTPDEHTGAHAGDGRECLKCVRGTFFFASFDNDLSACSPIETLLRLLLPLNDKVQWTSHDIAGSEPPTSP
ncbi:hypothetical protein R3W88_026002 [Solanum pinnatisectum]|uniref:Uncharacterized protein n=1 Tax=Solanum pinnatisectum TaxID=50273 RepID=A0AAV9M586_9SOLN|nr:hypothetical protein R3W88_026002 [Solanum pinnatisectum]